MKQTNQPLVEVVIPNWNGCEMLKCCLASLQAQLCKNFSVTVVDNGSTDDSISFIADNYPSVKIISFSENKGFSVAVNEGIQQAKSPWIFLLNNDIEVKNDCIENIVYAIKSKSDFDCFAVKMVNFNHREYLDGAGDAVLRGGAGYRLGTMEKDSSIYSVSREVFGACAGAAVYKRSFFEVAGLFDNDFFAYLEDVDLNMRARRRGLKTFYVAEAIVYHIGSATTGSKINSFTIRQSTKNSFHLLIKNYPASLLIRFLPVIFVYQCIWFVFTLKKGRVFSYFHGVMLALKESMMMLKKRKENQQVEGLISTEEFGKLLTNSEYEVVQSIMLRRESLGKGNLLLKVYQHLFIGL